MGKLLYDENFKHVSYHSTDVKKTFARIRKQQAEAKAKQEAEFAAAQAEAETIEAEAQRKVRRIAK